MAKAIYEYWFVQNADEKWEKKQIKEIADTGSGGTPLSTNKEYYENGNIPWINSSELNYAYITHTNNYITVLGLKNSSAKQFPSDSLLIALYGATAGKVSLLKIEATTNQAVCAVMPFFKIHTLYLKFFLSDLYKYLVNVSSGSARDNLSQELIRNLTVTVPESVQLEHFNCIVNPMIEKIIYNIVENKCLTTLRDYLLPLLMNGQVKC
jgi:type I restriction enzyme S subunit